MFAPRLGPPAARSKGWRIAIAACLLAPRQQNYAKLRNAGHGMQNNGQNNLPNWLGLTPDELYPRELRAAALRNCILVDDRSIFGNPHFQSTFKSDELAVPFGDASNDFKEAQNRPAHWPDWVLPDAGLHTFHTEWRKWQADPEGYTPPPKPTP